MIRKATHADIPRCVEMGRAFHGESGLVEIGFDADSVAVTMGRLVESDSGALFVAEIDGQAVGMAAALAFPHYFDAGSMVCQELWWWMDPAHRGGTAGMRLLMALEAWAHAVGCVAMTMLCLPIDSPAESIYSRCGYRPLERSYIKRL